MRFKDQNPTAMIIFAEILNGVYHDGLYCDDGFVIGGRYT